MKAFILAAGLGTRLKPLTDAVPKVMLDVGGRPVLEHLVRLCVKHGFPDIVVNLHHFPDVVTGHFGDGSRFNARIAYSDERNLLLGGAGALKKAEALLRGGPFLVLNGDTLTDLDLASLADFHRERGGTATFFVHETAHPHDSDLVECAADGRITRFFRAAPGENPRPLSKSGAHVFEAKALDLIPRDEFYSLEKNLIPDLLGRGERLYAFASDAYAVDMGTPERLEKVRRDYAAGRVRI